MKILAVVGTKNTGKTTLVTMLVQELVKRGHQVGTIKHTHHDFDLEGKDTWKHREAGARMVVGSGESTFFLINEAIELDKILKSIKNLEDLDYVIIEGFKHVDYPKISTTGDEDDFTITSVDVFNMDPEDVIPLADLVEERSYGLIPGSDCGECGFDSCLDMAKAIIRGEAVEEKCKMKKFQEVELFIDDVGIPLNPFVQDFIKKSIEGMVSSLKMDDAQKSPEKIELTIRNVED
ncbi:molybdopterin-guanine dinucleotide biosynthesis protein B [Methanobacterium formicicum]|uniref:Molybdopterin-guanine dinucleotide biosynthesis protein B n=1 Tax=Methanobacterium formicicum TaxID=2162 RepID=A0A090I3J5_METFO|nr:molybdopterin-guanine dinucleotide biosynthesis protein B [Methanobacterium formicicum]MDH2660575.1 molybdopterin-guanine dinucleotide biosynthesis protein B [Methanobacterium formicicum]CEA13823.1 molybdopterin-guanine dinucleotide biosynthesis protein B [Methanobacterium formicicum]